MLGTAAAQDKGPVPATPLKPAPAAPQKFDQEKMKAEHEKKLAKEVFKKAPWTFDYDKAREEAQKSGKPIFAYFSRSYAH